MPPTNPTLYDIGLFVAIAFFLLAGIKQILGIIDHFRAKPPAHEQFVKIPQCQELRINAKATLDHRLDAIDDHLENLDTGDRKGRSDIHRDVRKVEERVSKVEGQIELFGQRQVSQGNILDRILSELGEVKGRLNVRH
jgi:hypothetical protein